MANKYLLNFTGIVFWQNIISPHQLPFIREVQKASGNRDVKFVTSQAQREDLTSHGWIKPETGAVEIFVAPQAGVVEQLLSIEPQRTVHLLGGFRLRPYSSFLFSARRRFKIPLGIICEGADGMGKKGLIRRFIYSWAQIRYRRLVDFILAMGDNGVSWYRQAGWPHNRLFQFAYVTDPPAIQTFPSKNGVKGDPKQVQLLYVGQLIHRKGLDILLQALAKLRHRQDWRLTLVGVGASKEQLEAFVDASGMSSRISFVGMVPNHGVHAIMRDSDLLILPSRFDGWGAVVNEALMCGTPVLCSGQCGAKDLLEDASRGEAIIGGISEWANALYRRIERGKISPQERTRIQSWCKNIEGESVARYFISVLNNVYGDSARPTPPWKICTTI